VVPRIDPPVRILGRPTVDLLFSGLSGVSQFEALVTLAENWRIHLGEACRPLCAVSEEEILGRHTMSRVGILVLGQQIGS
jgi:hypothetical protein